MAIQSITFNQVNGGIGSPIPGTDYISGYLVYSASAPSGMTLGTPKPVFSLGQAEALGITNTYSDETKASGSVVISAVAAVGDIITINVTEPTINSGTSLVTLCAYTVKSTDTSTTILAASLAVAISGNLSTGYTATNTTNTVNIKARPGAGIILNTGTPLSVIESNVASPGVIGTITQFSGGTASKLAHYHYQISEYFRLQPSGKLWVGFYTTNVSYTYTELNSMQIYANGEIKQFMVYGDHGTTPSLITADLGAINAVCITMLGNYSPASVIYAPNIFGISDLTTLSNLRALTYEWVSCVIGQDGGALGAYLSLSSGKSIPAMGACLGTVSLAQVQQDIAWVNAFNLTNGTELETVAFSNGNLGYSISINEQTALDNYGYIFLIPKTGYTGTYWNDDHVANLITSDYNYIDRVRTYSKILRNTYISLVPFENSNIYLDPTSGQMSQSTINGITSAIAINLNYMVANGNISGFSINIPPKQNVLQTSSITINIVAVPVGVAREITVNIAYALSL